MRRKFGRWCVDTFRRASEERLCWFSLGPVTDGTSNHGLAVCGPRRGVAIYRIPKDW